jgi:V8-like Glu-specific endopeptidase
MGRIAHAGDRTFAHCTASLLEGGHVVTAAHCLPKVIEDPIHFGLAYDRGEATEIVSAQGSDYLVREGRDIAVLCGGASGTGLELAEAELPTDQVTFWGYGRPFVHILNQKSCAVTRSSARYLMLDCAATPGTSGGPVTVGNPPQVVGIVSRASRTETVVERFSASDLETFCPPSG